MIRGFRRGLAAIAELLFGGAAAVRTPLDAAWRDRRGVSAVEFGLAAPFLIVAILGSIEVGRLYWLDNTMQFAAAEAARYAMVHQTASDQQITDMAKSQAVGVSPDSFTVHVNTDTVNGVGYLTVTMSYPFDFNVPFVPSGLITLTGRSRVPRTF